MQNSTSKTQADHCERANGVDDSPLVTIEFLRARLLSERSVSRAANERVDELAKQVKELEEELKIVSIQRKRAEKATLDVLSYLESRGVSDISEVYESECDEEDSVYESNGLKCPEDEYSGPKKSKGDDNESSDSEHESTPSSSGSLSWKGRNKISQLLEKRDFGSPVQRRTALPVVNPSPRHRLGKSCRQVKRRERSAVEESRHDSIKSDIEDTNTRDSSDHHANFTETRGEELKNYPERRLERGLISFQDEAQNGDARRSNCRHECSGEMERALTHQAHLIGLYQSQEKAQSDWEEKYVETQVSIVDSYEPGSHSDVTEDRDDNKVLFPHPGNGACNGNVQKAVVETDIQSKTSINHLKSFKLSSRGDAGGSEVDKFNGAQSSGSLAHDFVFPTVQNGQTLKHEECNSFHEADLVALRGKSTLQEPHYPNLDGQHGFVPHERLQSPGVVLNALQEAKALLKNRVDRLPEFGKFAERAVGSSVSALNDIERINIPAACPGLFRVPSDFLSQASVHNRSLVSQNAMEFTDSFVHARASYLQGYENISSPSSRIVDAFSSSPVYSAEFGPTRPRVDLYSNINVVASSPSTILPNSSLPQRMPSNQMLISQFPRSEAGVPPSVNPLYHHDPYMYR